MALEFNLTGKIFLASVAGYLGVKALDKFLESTDSGAEPSPLAKALMSSPLFREELSRPGATAAGVIEKLGIGRMTPAEFERVLGVPWPL